MQKHFELVLGIQEQCRLLTLSTLDAYSRLVGLIILPYELVELLLFN